MIRFITHHHIGKDLLGRWNSAGPSGRLRCIYPAKVLSQLIGELKLHSLYERKESNLSATFKKDDVIIISKLIRMDQLEFVSDLRKIGCRLIIDFCDNYFEGGEHMALTLQLLKLASVVTVNSPEMANVVVAQNIVPKEDIVYVPDAIEELETSILTPFGRPIRLLSYGNRLVCNHLNRWMPVLEKFSSTHELSLEVVTNVDEQTLKWVKEWNLRLHSRFQVSLTRWDEFALDGAFRRSDIAVIPSDPTDKFNLTKSPNRLMEAFSRNKSAIAYPLKSYLPFRHNSLLTDKIDEAILILSKQTLEERKENLSKSRELMSALFSSEVLSLAWLWAISKLHSKYSSDLLKLLSAPLRDSLAVIMSHSGDLPELCSNITRVCCTRGYSQSADDADTQYLQNPLETIYEQLVSRRMLTRVESNNIMGLSHQFLDNVTHDSFGVYIWRIPMIANCLVEIGVSSPRFNAVILKISTYFLRINREIIVP